MWADGVGLYVEGKRMIEGRAKTRQAPQRTLSRLRANDPERLRATGYHHDGGGLYLQVREGKGGLTRSWAFRYTRQGRARIMGLGPLALVSLPEAREKAREARKLLQAGVDPLEAREAQRASQATPSAPSVTFQQAAQSYMDAHDAAWGAIHAAQWRNSLGAYAFPKLGGLPVAAIDTGRVLSVVEPIWKSKTETASRVRNRIEKVLDWATVRELRSGDNPARWKGHLEHILPARGKVRRVEHFAALPYPEMPAFMAALRARAGVAARALEFAILVAGRSKEVRGARWSEINFAERLWTVPAERMKAKREHRVPLSDAALAILAAQRGASDFVFPSTKAGRRALNNNAFYDLLRRIGRGGLTSHGFRSSFRDWAAERSGFPAEVAEMALAHSVGSAVEQAYRRSDLFDRRRQLAEDWARWCDGRQEESENVIPIRAADGLRQAYVEMGRAP
jgi:integrase